MKNVVNFDYLYYKQTPQKLIFQRFCCREYYEPMVCIALVWFTKLPTNHRHSCTCTFTQIKNTGHNSVSTKYCCCWKSNGIYFANWQCIIDRKDSKIYTAKYTQKTQAADMAWIPDKNEERDAMKTIS